MARIADPIPTNYRLHCHVCQTTSEVPAEHVVVDADRVSTAAGGYRETISMYQAEAVCPRGCTLVREPVSGESHLLLILGGAVDAQELVDLSTRIADELNPAPGTSTW